MINTKECPVSAERLLFKLETVIRLDKQYWKTVLGGERAVNPLLLKIIVNRLLGKAEKGDALLTENVLAALKLGDAETPHWRAVFDSAENAAPEQLIALFYAIL
ncbi:MAG: hypothetical protein LBU77_05765 [Clostridiales bacterium]|jgi:hypothetical protein|nr:hypothetical protein [Clostridiales bacterium]